MAGVQRIPLLLLCGISAGLVMGQVPNTGNGMYVVPISMRSCQDSQPLVQLTFNLHEGGEMADVEFEIEEEFTDSYQAQLIYEEWDGKQWKDSNLSTKGGVCQLMLRYGPKVWKNVRNILNSDPSDDCSVKPGHYKINDFTVSKTDYTAPIPKLGKFRVTVTIFDDFDNELLMCHVFEVEVLNK